MKKIKKDSKKPYKPQAGDTIILKAFICAIENFDPEPKFAKKENRYREGFFETTRMVLTEKIK